MRILLNTANLSTGGGLRIGMALIQEWLQRTDTLLVLASPQMAALLTDAGIPETYWIRIPERPGSSLTARKKFRNLARQAEYRFKPDAVFTVFGPPLWKPQVPHLCGFANGLYFPEVPVQPYGGKPSWLKLQKHRLKRWLLFRSLQKDTDALWVETEAARQKLLELVSGKEIFVVPNELPAVFQKASFERKTSVGSPLRVLLIAAGYPHKNFALVQELIRPSSGFLPISGTGAFLFQTTLPQSEFEKYFPDPRHLQNLGPLSTNQLVEAYQNADFIFCPSVAEIFSATWIEAMAAKRPLVCADIPEARAVCGDAALYFDASDLEKVAAALRQIATDKALRKSLVEKGTSRLHALTPEMKRAELLYQMLHLLNGRK